MRVGVRINNT